MPPAPRDGTLFKRAKSKMKKGHHPSFAKKVMNVIKKVSEIKYHDTTHVSQALQTQSAVTGVHLLTTTQGLTDAGSRIGDMTNLLSIDLKYWVKSEAATALVPVAGVNGHMARVIIVQSHEQNTIPLITDFLAGSDIIAQYTRDTVSRKKAYTILYDKKHVLCPGGVGSAAINIVDKKITKRIRKEIQYNAGSTDPIYNDVLIYAFYETFAVANEDVPTWGYNIRINYLDV